MIELPAGAQVPGPERMDPDPVADPGLLEQVPAAWTAETIRTDAWGYADKMRRGIVEDLRDRLPEAERSRIADTAARARNLSLPRRRALEERLLFETMARLGRDQLTAPRFDGMPRTPEALEDEVNRRRLAELEEAEATLAMNPSMVAGFVGAGARAMTDPVSLALLPLGGTVGVGRAAVLKFLGREAALGGAAEAAILPREFEVADELGLPDPDVASRIAIGATAGAAFGGAILGAQRVAQYALGRRAPGRPDAVAPDEHEADVAAAEADLLSGQSPADMPVTIDAPAAMDSLVDRIIAIESGGNPSAANPNSSAAGLGQFIDSTWLDMIRRHRPDLMDGRSRAEVLALKFDADLNRDMTRIFTQENMAFLQARGLPTTPGDVYLAHFLGRGGAAEVLRAGADLPIRAVLSRDAITANRGIRHAGKPFGEWTVADMRAWAASKMHSAPPAPPATTGAGADFGGYTSRGYTETGQVAAGDMVVDVRYEVVDAADLQFASGDLQPRDRSRATSDEQIADIAARLDPARLMPAPEADRGAPVVGPDGMIESGNGRVRAIQRAAEVAPDRLGAYRRQIEMAGYRVPEGVRVPVLIARRTSAMDDAQRAAFAYRANSPDVARMSATEIARAHARLIDGALLGRLDMTRPLANQANRDFARGFLTRLPQAERGAYTTARGGLSYDGERALEAALFARAFEADDLLAQFAERGDPALKSFIAALQEAAPAWAALRAEIASGTVDASLDISPFVNEALMLIGEARRIAAQTERLGIAQAIEDMLVQDDMFDALSPLTAALVRKFFQNGRTASAEQIAAFLKDYAAEAIKIGAGDLMDDLPGPLDVLRVLDRATFAGIEDVGRPKGRAEARPDPALAQPVPDLFAEVADSAELEAQNRAALAGARALVDVTEDETPAPTPRTVDEILNVTARADGQRTVVDFKALSKPDRLALDAAMRARQGFRDLDEMIAAAQPFHDALNDIIEGVTRELGRDFKRAPLKGKERALDKITDKYGGDINKATDIARGGMTVERFQEADLLLSRIAQRFHVIDEGWEVTPVGYFDRKATIVFDNGQLGELQIWPPGMLAAKENAEVVERFGWPATYLNDKGVEKPFKGGHALYEIWRRNDTAEDVKSKAADNMRQIYDDVLAGLDPSFSQALGFDAPTAASRPSSSPASTGVDRMSETISETDAGRQSPRDQTRADDPSGETAASMVPSTSQNVMGDTSNPDIAPGGGTRNSDTIADARADLERLREILGPEAQSDFLDEIRATLNEVEAEDALADVLDTCTLRFRGGST